ncbi:AKL1 [[Candida] subhashii]|uniref:AKL1 n=1 Tax=[Candida] subhashii TaxID=561895 RepID=A0A8J5UZC1_9ASCO|nr:AKL1 [[Candida] subhashii]KAG7664835.1 AKL1 [[Candida] subhashii]
MANFPKLPPGTELQVGSHKVQIIKYLSEGGFAHIYKVSIDPIEDDSNIACLKRVIVPDKNGLNTLRKEVDVMKTLRHGRNIVKYFDSHAERLPNGTYQVLVLMELCPNKSLLDYMNAHIKTKLAEHEILSVMLDIAQGIYEMHKLKLIHRDIKIENVLIDAKHRFKVCDFGSTTVPIMPPQDQQQFAFLSHDILYHTTPQYRAPEMIDLYRGLPIDEKSDVWALGCFLYKLCYFTTPFEANGDIAILHASFQFPPKPKFSGDLKNLIIIMLQENPIFRPNIVQVLMLISKMAGFEFEELGLSDFYKLGPYNFQALHEYQVHKQNEIMRQKQLYFQQQLISSSQAPSTASLPMPASVPIPGRQNLPATAGAAACLTGPVNKTPQNYVPAVHASLSENNLESQRPPHEDVEELKPQPKPNLLGVPAIEIMGQQNSNESALDSSDNEELLDDMVDFENLENAEARFPSLDDIDNEIKTTLNKAASAKTASDVRIDHQTIESSKKRQSSMQNEPASQVSRKASLEVPVSKGNTRKSSDDIPRVASEQSLSAEKSNSQNSTEYHSIQAWEKQPQRVSIDTDTERIADDIFGVSKTETQDKIPVEEMNTDLPVKNMNHDETTSVSIPIPMAHDSNLLDLSDDLDAKLSISNEKPTVVFQEQPDQKRNSNPFPYPAVTPNIGKIKAPLPELSISQQSSTNPWGEYRMTPSESSSQAQVQTPITAPQAIAGISNNANIDPGTLRSPQDQFHMSSSLEAPRPQVFVEQPNLIDLEIGLSSSTSTVSLLNSNPPPKIENNFTMGQGDSKVSLIDLEVTEEPIIKSASDTPKPNFKKRTGGTTSSVVPDPNNLKFEEEIIDFASDDENPDNAPTMNRMSIRKSLKKSRRSGEHKRPESLVSETRKRISFFGGD